MLLIYCNALLINAASQRTMPRSRPLDNTNNLSSLFLMADDHGDRICQIYHANAVLFYTTILADAYVLRNIR